MANNKHKGIKKYVPAIKKGIKKILGEAFIRHGFYIFDVFCRVFSIKKSIVLTDKTLKYELISLKNHHVFGGYYEINHFNKNENLVLLHILKKGAGNNKNTQCGLAYYDLDKHEITAICDTSLWNWQQGSRLRWNPVNENQVVFNEVHNNRYCAKVYDIAAKKEVRRFDMPLYDINTQFTLGLSLNFSRLQRLRPGYGYDLLEDVTRYEKAPKNDGVFLVDLNTNETNLMICLYDLALKADPAIEAEHYINHLCFCPDGKKFMFLHIYQKPEHLHWNTVLYVYMINDGNLSAIEENDLSSHYCWINNTELMIICYTKDGKQIYRFYNIQDHKKNDLTIDGLDRDGHPSFISREEVFITDTYPDKNRIQTLLFADIKKRSLCPILKLYHDPRMYGEKRCDLHPSISRSGRLLSVDTTFQKGLRSMVIVKNDFSVGT